jgi:hypothetical protein
MTLVAGSEIAADTIVMRELKGSPLSTADFDWDLETLMGAINTNIAAIAEFGAITSYTMAAGQTTLTVGTDLEAGFLEVVFLAAGAAEELQQINGANSGDIKIFIMTNDNVTVVRNDFYIKTKNPLLSPNFDADTGDVVALVNNGGVAGTASNGTWIEIFRSLQV